MSHIVIKMTKTLAKQGLVEKKYSHYVSQPD